MEQRDQEDQLQAAAGDEVQLPCWVPGASRWPSWGLSRAKPAWWSGGTPPAKAPVDGEGKSAKFAEWDEESVAWPCGEEIGL